MTAEKVRAEEVLKDLPNDDATDDLFYDCVMAATGGDEPAAQDALYKRVLNRRRAAVAARMRANG